MMFLSPAVSLIKIIKGFNQFNQLLNVSFNKRHPAHDRFMGEKMTKPLHGERTGSP